MGKPKYTKEQLEEARRLFGIETPERLDEAVHNFREFLSILNERDAEDRALEADQDAETSNSH